MSLDSATLGYLKDVSLTGLSSDLVMGAKLCIHTAQWCWEKTGTASLNGDKLTYVFPTQVQATTNYAYFLYDNLSHLDTALEWKYDTLSHTLHFIPQVGLDPNTSVCEASVFNNGIDLSVIPLLYEI